MLIYSHAYLLSAMLKNSLNENGCKKIRFSFVLKRKRIKRVLLNILVGRDYQVFLGYYVLYYCIYIWCKHFVRYGVQ